MQVIELLFQQAGRANQININLSAFFKFFLDFQIEYDLEGDKYENLEDEFISE